VSGPNAEAASLGEDIPCAAGVRGDGPCSFELCPPGIGCRRVREQRRQGEGGAVLGEVMPLIVGPNQEAMRQRFRDAGYIDNPAAEQLAADVANDERARRAYERGRADGAAEERERIARRFDSMDGDGWGSLAPVVAGLFEQVARIVRGTS
jgi:hypothetical protein